MRRPRILLGLVLSMAVGGAALLGAGGAQAATASPASVPLADDVRSDVTAFFDEYGVDRVTQQRLVSVIESGGRWEAMSADSTPIASETSEALGPNDHRAETVVDRYSDGSVSVRSLELPADDGAIGGCSRSGTSYSNCTVDFWYGLVSMSFKADYSLASGKNRITNQWGATWTIGGACSTSKNYFGRPSSTRARLEVQAQMCSLPYTTTFYLELSVGGNRAGYTYG